MKENHTLDRIYPSCENDNKTDICDEEVSRLTSFQHDNNMESVIPNVESVTQNQIVSSDHIENADIYTGSIDNVTDFVKINDTVNENSDVTVEDLYNLEVNDLVKMLDKEPQMVEYVGALMNQENFGHYIPPGITSESSHAEEAFLTISEELNQPSVSDTELDVILNDIFNAPTANVSENNEQLANDNNEPNVSLNNIYQALTSVNETEKIQHDEPTSNNEEKTLSVGFSMPNILPDLYWEQN